MYDMLMRLTFRSPELLYKALRPCRRDRTILYILTPQHAGYSRAQLAAICGTSCPARVCRIRNQSIGLTFVVVD